MTAQLLPDLLASTASALPTRRDERWRYSDLRPLARRRFAIADGDASTAALAPPLPFAHACEVVLVGAEVRIPSLPPQGVTLTALSAADMRRADQTAALDGFAALNAAAAPSGLLLSVAAGAALAAPIVITHLLPPGAERVGQPRLRVTLAPGARAQVIERFVAPRDAASEDQGLCNAVTRVELGVGSALQHMHLQDQAERASHLALLEGTLDADARLDLRALHLGALLGRFAARITLAGRGAAVTIDSLNAIDGRRQGDMQLEVVHAVGGTTSRQTYRGLAAGRGKAAATTRATVSPAAAGCDATQSLGSLLLSPHAEVAARPELEIENDDVRCSHGATIGQLDEAALFYLRSRGLGEDEARAALIFAFADDVLAALPRDDLRRHLEDRLRQRLGQGAVA